MDVDNASVTSANPQAPITIAKKFQGLDLTFKARRTISVRLTVDEMTDSAAAADQQRAVIRFGKRSKPVQLSGHRVEFRGPGLPPPYSIHHSHPERALPVLIQAYDSRT